MNEDRGRRRLAQDLATRARAGGVIYFLSVIIVGVSTALYEQQPAVFIAFASLQLVVAGYRWGWTSCFATLYPQNPRRWYRGMLLGANLSAVIWGAFAALVILNGSGESALVSVVGSSALAAGGAATFAPDRRLLKQFLVLLLLPSAIAAFFLFDTLGFAMSVALLTFILYFWGFGMRQHRAYWTALYDNELLRRQATELEQARLGAVASVRSKDAFLATMSHELRTPMNAVIGAGDLMLTTVLSPEQKEYAETILTGGNTLLRVINDILDFSKIQADKLVLEAKPFDVRHCVEGALDLISIKAAEKGLELGYFVDPAVPAMVQGDCTRLRQILVNLAGNAVKFTEQGQVIVRVSSHALDPSPPLNTGVMHEVKITVRDTGIGIPADRLDQLFKPFSQVDSSTTRRYGGTGLGLSISKRIAEHMGGTVWVESRQGIGSTFYCTLRAPVIHGERPAYLLGGLPEFDGKRVLVIDNNPAVRGHLAAYLTGWGLYVHATTGTQAYEVLKAPHAFDLILVDQRAFGSDTFVRAVHPGKTLDRGHSPIVMMVQTGLMNRGELPEHNARVLKKPVKPSVFYEILLEVFKPDTASSSLPERAVEGSARPTSEAPLRILLAEDNLVNKKIMLHLLAKLGYQADWVDNGRDVIRRLECAQYDLVFMDMQMPEMDGLEATQMICQRWAEQERPWITALTANALPQDKERCLEAGMDDYLSKPVKMADLRAAIQRCEIRSWPIENT